MNDYQNIYQIMLQVKLLNSTAKLPTRGKPGDAGLDLYATETHLLVKGCKAIISTGIAVAIPKGTYGRVAPRSGLAAKYGIDVGAGVCDETFRGEIKVVLFNHGDSDYLVNVGDRIAQLIITPYIEVEVVESIELEKSVRGTDGFGSTGK
jgi:dUTP pyrophosphatase